MTDDAELSRIRAQRFSPAFALFSFPLIAGLLLLAAALVDLGGILYMDYGAPSKGGGGMMLTLVALGGAAFYGYMLAVRFWFTKISEGVARTLTYAAVGIDVVLVALALAGLG